MNSITWSPDLASSIREWKKGKAPLSNVTALSALLRINSRVIKNGPPWW